MRESLNKSQIERFSRQLVLKNIGAKGQKKILSSKILIVGVGGLGCPAAESLVRAGIGNIGLIDNDIVNLSNIHRQSLFNSRDIKKSKVSVAAKKLKDIMIKDIQAATTDTDQEEVAKKVAQYNYLALPVVNRQNRFLGIVTIDDVVDIIREEASEDFLQMAGVGKDREILLKSPFENAQSRAPWILASLIGGICAAAIISYFNNLLEQIIVLAAFIPVIIGIGGNVGTQSSTIVVRGLATGRVDVTNTFPLIFKEVIVGSLLGATYGLLVGLASEYITGTSMNNLGLVIGLSIFCSMTIATAVGASVPIILKKLNFDPAISTGPFVTTAIDIIGVALYFLIASTILIN